MSGVCVCVNHLCAKVSSFLGCRGAMAHLSTLPNEAKRDVVEAEWDAVLCTCTAAPCGAKA